MATSQHSPEAEKKEILQGSNDAANINPSVESEPVIKPDQQLPTKPPPLIWFLTCVGLYLGALLYGKKPSILSTTPAKQS
jgi:hypothetical protein